MQVLLQFMKKNLEIMIDIVLEQFRKIENSSRTLEHVFAGAYTLMVAKLDLFSFFGTFSISKH